MGNCSLCPRKCNTDRKLSPGACRTGDRLFVAKACLHFWEEPCIASSGGAGTIFFSGCNLGCIYCQNMEISRGQTGKEISVDRLCEIFDELVWQGADTIDLVTPTHFSSLVAEALMKNKPSVPVVYNSSGYESTEQLKELEGLVDVYLPDYKYAQSGLASVFSHAPDYPDTAFEAVKEMYRQTGDYVLDGDGMLQKGVMIRHLVLPGHVDNTLDCIDRITETFSDEKVLFSLMSQYTPPREPLKYPELNRRLTKEEYDEAVDYMYLCGIENGYVQELSSAKEEYTPDFDLTGV